MLITIEQIEAWREVISETRILEFKEAKNSYPNQTLFEYCAAISNEGGGYFVLGMTNQRPRQVTGTNAFLNPAKTENLIFERLHFKVTIEEVIHQDGRVVVFDIPKRPRGTIHRLDGRYLMRCGESTRDMSDEMIRSIFDEGKPDWLEEHSLMGLSDQDVVELLDTQKFFELLRVPYPTNREGVINRLLDVDLIERDGSKFAIRRMGAVLFAKQLKPFPELELKATRVTVYAGTTKIVTKQVNTGVKGYAVSFQALVSHVIDQLPQNEVLENHLNKEVKLLPDVVLRELLANALVHQDFSVTGRSLDIEVYADRVEMMNPGDPSISCDRFIDSQLSRNARLVNLMRKFGICEERGTGVDKVVACAEIYQLPAPNWRHGVGRTICTVFGPKPFDKMRPDDRIRACFQHCSLKYVSNDRMTNESLRERFGLEESKGSVVTKIIASAVDLELIKPDEAGGASRRYARYLPYWA